MTRRFGLIPVLAAVAPLVGCGLIYEYPKTNAEQSAGTCDDGIDNDLDGRADCFDSGCSDFCSEADAAACSDAVDNDGDGDIDCHDGSCLEHCREEDTAACDDGKDNDLDGDVDCRDAACSAFCLETSAEACADGEDNDVDGAVDCADDDCSEHCPESSAETCEDGDDNDHDGKVDCQDSSCDGFCPERSPSDCDDGRDNDGDGLVDGADALCWLVRPPSALRCGGAPPVDFFDGFDAPSYGLPFYGPRWSEYGLSKRVTSFGDPIPIIDGTYRSGLARDDYWLRFTDNRGETGVLDQDLASMVHGGSFSGAWRDLSLSALVFVPRSSQLRLMLAPEHLVPDGQAPLAAAESAQLAVLLDGAAASPTLSLLVEGQSFSTELPLPRACGLAYCEAGWASLSLTVEDERFVLRLDGTGGETSVSAPLPSHESFQFSRLALRMGTIDSNVVAGLDDLTLTVRGGTPCNARVPQVPAVSCEAAAQFENHGFAVSLAASGDLYCALVVSGNRGPEAVTSWTTRDGIAFDRADLNVALPEDASPSSVALATGPAGLGIALSYVVAGQLEVGLGSVDDCSGDVELLPGPPLPLDAEAVSYVITEAGEHQLYFTRPATDQTQRTLWRFQAQAQNELESLQVPELMAELPSGTGQPAVVQRIGTGDLVLSYPTMATQGPPALALLVSDASARDWGELEAGPLLGGQGAPGFDQQGVQSVALAASATGGFVLYGGSEAGVLTVGTALLELSGVAPPELGALALCGDGACDAAESCATCSADCACSGPTILSDALTLDKGWDYVGGLVPEGDFYFDDAGTALNWNRSTSDQVLALPLAGSVNGDFELSFDFTLSPTSDIGQCDSLNVGLGPMPDDTTVAAPLGVFARLTYSASCETGLLLSPQIRTVDEEFKAFGPFAIGMCREGGLEVPLSRKVRVLLRRVGGLVTVLTADESSCEEQAQLHYSGALPDLSTLLFASVRDCFNGSGRLTNLELRLLSDPDDCPSGTELCGGGADANCVDTASSQEHCGECGNACGPGLACVDGECTCDDRYLACGGTCVDPQVDYDHCGSCTGVCDQFCFIGQCDVGETCDAPAVLPSGSTKVTFDPWYQYVDFTALCADPSLGDATFSWTAEKSGLTTLEVQGVEGEVSLELAVTEDATCAQFLKCEEGYESDMAGGQRVIFRAEAGTEYRIVVALTETADDTLTELRIEAP